MNRENDLIEISKVSSITLILENNLLYKAYLNNMQNKIYHIVNVINKSKNTLVIQVDEKFLSNKS